MEIALRKSASTGISNRHYTAVASDTLIQHGPTAVDEWRIDFERIANRVGRAKADQHARVISPRTPLPPTLLESYSGTEPFRQWSMGFIALLEQKLL